METDIFGFKISSRKPTINSKKKGNKNELVCAKALEKWTGVKFARTPQSGALRRINSDNLTSDIYPDTNNKDFYYPFSTETKALKNIKIENPLKRTNNLYNIWEQVTSDAIRGNKLPIAFLRANGMPADEYYVILDMSYGGNILMLNTPVAFKGSNSKFSIMGFMFSDILKCMPYATFAHHIKSRNFVESFITKHLN